jgi:hypothetical protein
MRFIMKRQSQLSHRMRRLPSSGTEAATTDPARRLHRARFPFSNQQHFLTAWFTNSGRQITGRTSDLARRNLSGFRYDQPPESDRFSANRIAPYRHSASDDRSFTGRASDLERSSDRSRAVLHVLKPHLSVFRGFDEAFTVVSNGQRDSSPR